MAKYYARLIDKTLKLELNSFGAVLISGPKWCGKTTTAMRFSNSMINLQDPINKRNYLNILSINPDILLSENSPMLIDEWQEAPQVWDYVRQTVDKKGKKGLYILTGSSTVDSSLISHSGAGRISRILMRTLSLFESGNSNGSISLEDIFNNKDFTSSKSSLTINDYAELVVRGGFPATIESSLEIARRQIDSYIDIIANQELPSIYGGTKNPQIIKKIIKILARHTATQASMNTLLKDIENEDVKIHIDTLSNYLNALRNLYIIEDLPAWTPKLRSKAIVRESNTRHFIDPALAARSLNANPTDLLLDFETFGFLFESLVIRDLRIYTEYLGGHVSHYRDSYGYECDAIIHLDNGKWGLVEVKLGNLQIEKAAKNLIHLKNTINARVKPTFLMIITGGQFAYQRDDGVYVVPIGCLKP